MTKHKKKDKWAPLDPKKQAEEREKDLEREEKEFEALVKEKK